MSTTQPNDTYGVSHSQFRAGQYRIADSGDIPEGGRLVVDIQDEKVGVFRVDGKLYGYLNRCAHMGGPVCQGLMVPRVVEKLNGQKQVVASEFKTDDPHIVCPWHGMEYSIITGAHAGDARIKLRKVNVMEQEDGIYVSF